MGFKYANFPTYFHITDIMEKNFLSNPLKSTNQKIDLLCIKKFLKFVLDIMMVGFCSNSFVITCKGRTWCFQLT